jgi:hypothetical protein
MASVSGPGVARTSSGLGSAPSQCSNGPLALLIPHVSRGIPTLVQSLPGSRHLRGQAAASPRPFVPLPEDRGTRTGGTAPFADATLVLSSAVPRPVAA